MRLDAKRRQSGLHAKRKAHTNLSQPLCSSADNLSSTACLCSESVSTEVSLAVREHPLPRIPRTNASTNEILSSPLCHLYRGYLHLCCQRVPCVWNTDDDRRWGRNHLSERHEVFAADFYNNMVDTVDSHLFCIGQDLSYDCVTSTFDIASSPELHRLSGKGKVRPTRGVGSRPRG